MRAWADRPGATPVSGASAAPDVPVDLGLVLVLVLDGDGDGAGDAHLDRAAVLETLADAGRREDEAAGRENVDGRRDEEPFRSRPRA